jgi:AraC-like DNA-binding protein
MDATDLALRDLRVTGSMVGRTLVDPPWGLTLESDDSCMLAAVVAGEMWATRGDGPPVHLGLGDIVVACGGAPLRLGHRPDSVADVVVTDRDACYDPATGADLSESCSLGGRTFGDPDGSVSILVGGYDTIGEIYALLAQDLPPVMIVPAGSDTSPILDVIVAETEADRPGQQVTVDRLMELLALASLRKWLRTAPAEVPSWAASLDDPVVGPALHAMHVDPARPWTVAELAALAAVSRATFARRFTLRVGVAPLTHLARWRMALATDLMRADPRLGLADVAARVGYADAFSFSNAYRRVRGVAPSAARGSLARTA